MNRRSGLSKLVTRKWCLYQVSQAVLLFGIVITLTCQWLMHESLDISHSIRPRYTYTIPQATTKNQSLYQKNTSQLKVPHFKDTFTEDGEFADLDDTCPVFNLRPNQNRSENTACKRADFVPGSCRLMKTLFRGRPADCSHQPTNIICEFKIFKPRKPQIHCHHDICKKFSPVFIGLYQSELGSYTWHKLNSSEELESFINSELLVDFRENYPNSGYCLIQCNNKDEKFVSQILILPPILRANTKTFQKKSGQKNVLNVNILLLDSVSRHHFYRTLPQTIQTFKDLNNNDFKRGHIFDFELVQGIKGRTFESLQALFGGDEISLPIFDAIDLPPKPVNINETMGKFKANGYETLYVEDMCWLGEWGLVKEQRALNLSVPFKERLKLFNEAIYQAGIDRLDVSYSSCLILQENKVTDVFHGPASICYNGIHQHTYLFLYMEYFLSRFSSLHKATFTFLILDTGHEDTGIRIKQVDQDLARHVSFLARQRRTISFILSDHGNTYGQFVSASPESQVEIFHPFLFIIVPDEVSKILGNSKMNSLYINQNRLISLLDVHYTLTGLLPFSEQMKRTFPMDNINTDGLLSPVSKSRTCKDIPRMHPNLCICQASYTMEQNNSYYALFAEYALGYMNRRIAELQTDDSKGACLKLIATRFDNVKKSIQEDLNETVILLDLSVMSGSRKGYKEEKFTVNILYSSNTVMEGMLFLGYNRLTTYSIYRQCANSAVDLRLCICETDPLLVNETMELTEVMETVLWTRTYRTLIHKPCLYLLTRNYTSGVVLSICNICSDVQYKIVFNFLTKNLYSSNQMPVLQFIGPKTEKLLVVGVRKVENQSWQYKYTLSFKAFTLKNG